MVHGWSVRRNLLLVAATKSQARLYSRDSVSLLILYDVSGSSVDKVS